MCSVRNFHFRSIKVIPLFYYFIFHVELSPCFFHMWGQSMTLPVPLSGPFLSISTCAQSEALKCIPKGDRCYVHILDTRYTSPAETSLQDSCLTLRCSAMKDLPDMPQCWYSTWTESIHVDTNLDTKWHTTIIVPVGHQGRCAIFHTRVILIEVATATVQTIEAPHQANTTGWVAGL